MSNDRTDRGAPQWDVLTRLMLEEMNSTLANIRRKCEGARHDVSLTAHEARMLAAHLEAHDEALRVLTS